MVYNGPGNTNQLITKQDTDLAPAAENWTLKGRGKNGIWGHMYHPT